MAELIRGLDAARVRARYEDVRAEVGDGVEVLAAVKYVAPEEMCVLVEAGIEVVGENRQQALAEKQRVGGAVSRLTWDFIGQLQSRKVKDLVGRVRYIHSVASDSALKELGKHGTADTQVLVEVNVAEDPSKAGVLPAELDDFIARCPVRVVGLMTMPPLADRPEDNRRWFAALAQLAADRGLPHLSMGTTQDYAVAAQEGATIVRIGTKLYA